MGPAANFFLYGIFFRQLRVCYFVAPSLTRGRVCNLMLLLVLASAVPLGCDVLWADPKENTSYNSFLIFAWNNWEIASPKCIGYSDANQYSPQAKKLLTYRSILKPILSYRIRPWGTTSTSNIRILGRFQSKASSMIVDAPSYIPNTVSLGDLQTPAVKEEIRHYSSQYSARLSTHPNDLIVNLTELPDNRRLRKHLPNDILTRFLV
jgi:hypothetical protein